MITRPTTLVLGAGASAAFGFPSGYRLYTEVCQEIANANSPLFKLLTTCVVGGHARAFQPEELKRFQQALYRCGCSSIDAFLEGRAIERRFIEIGKAAMAAKLLPFERDANLLDQTPRDHSHNDDWYRYLWTLLQAPLEKFHENKLSDSDMWTVGHRAANSAMIRWCWSCGGGTSRFC